jgi:hypothetical protein
LYYKTDDGFMFEVPVGEVGGAHLSAEERSSTFMKWIKCAVDLSNKEY